MGCKRLLSRGGLFWTLGVHAHRAGQPAFGERGQCPGRERSRCACRGVAGLFRPRAGPPGWSGRCRAALLVAQCFVQVASRSWPGRIRPGTGACMGPVRTPTRVRGVAVPRRAFGPGCRLTSLGQHATKGTKAVGAVHHDDPGSVGAFRTDRVVGEVPAGPDTAQYPRRLR